MKTMLRAMIVSFAALFAAQGVEPTAVPTMPSQWSGKKVAFLGDSITDKRKIGTSANYWLYLSQMMGFESWVYGINGHDWNGVLGQAKKLKEEKGDAVDAILIFAGTNDYNSGVPLGEWWQNADEKVNSHGKEVVLSRRHPNHDQRTFRGRINVVMEYIKENFPMQQVILLTPIHRGFAQFGGANIQPEESFPNPIGLYVDAYVDVIREAGNVWAVPVIDLNSVSGLYPLTKSHGRFFHDTQNDLLHPNAEGHRRMAKAIAYQLLAFPADLK